jgi:hypothetical protein
MQKSSPKSQNFPISKFVCAHKVSDNDLFKADFSVIWVDLELALIHLNNGVMKGSYCKVDDRYGMKFKLFLTIHKIEKTMVSELLSLDRLTC